MAKLLYFAALADRLGQTSEDVALPTQVGDVRSLLAWLRTRGGPWEQWLADNAVRVTVKPAVQGCTGCGAEGRKPPAHHPRCAAGRPQRNRYSLYHPALTAPGTPLPVCYA